MSLGMLPGCGGSTAEPLSPVRAQSPQDAIFRIGKTWQAQSSHKGLQSKPSPIAAFDQRTTSRLELTAGEPIAVEFVTVEERLTLRAGGSTRCGTEIRRDVEVAYGRRTGEPAVELGWAAQTVPRMCDDAAAVPPLQLDAGRSRFVLRSDRLVAVEPPLEKREFVPVD